jgi:hypothetical protein
VKIIGVGDFQNNLYAPLADLNEVHLDGPVPDDYLVKGKASIDCPNHSAKEEAFISL